MTAQGMPVGEDVAEPIVKVSVRLEDGHRASSLPRRWSLPCRPARRTEQIREGVVMQFGFFNDAEGLGYDSVCVTDSQMIFSDCYAVLALAARQTRRIPWGRARPSAARGSLPCRWRRWRR